MNTSDNVVGSLRLQAAQVPPVVPTVISAGEVTVPALSGSTLRLKIPELTPNGRVFRLRRHGMPTVGKAIERGDLYATVEIEIPSQLTPDERRHYEALKKLAEG